MLLGSIIPYMEKIKWKLTLQESERMEVVWMQVKGACEKLQEEINAKDEDIYFFLHEMAHRY